MTRNTKSRWLEIIKVVQIAKVKSNLARLLDPHFAIVIGDLWDWGYPLCVYPSLACMECRMCMNDGWGCSSVPPSHVWCVWWLCLYGCPVCVCGMSYKRVCIREVVPLSWQLKCSSMSSRALPTCRYETDCQVSRGLGGRWDCGGRMWFRTRLRREAIRQAVNRSRQD